jgi:hypothetical protein
LGRDVFCRIAEALGFDLRYKTWRNEEVADRKFIDIKNFLSFVESELGF